MEAGLVERAQSGDPVAVNQLLSEHYDYIYSVCRRVSGNEADAADCTQEALIAIVRGLPRFSGQSSFRSWSYRVATNAALDELRRRVRRPVPASDTITESQVAIQGFATTVSNSIVVNEALDRLDPTFRVPLVLREFIGMNYNEIARQLDIPVGTVRSRLARARRQLLELTSQTLGTNSSEGAS